MRRIAPLIALLLLLGSAPAARAGQITIDFDLSGSSISILGGAIVVPPDGSITSAGTTLQVQGSGNANASAGPARLRSLMLAGTISPTTLLGGAVTVSGGVSASQIGSAAGVLNPALTLAAFGGTGVLSINALINCTPPGSSCSLLGLPISISGPQTFSPFGSFQVGSINNVGNATLGGQLSLTLGGLTAVLNLVGTEISRTYVPEPSTFSLLGMALIGVAACYRRRVRPSVR
jgi:hypothetical protein